MPEVGLGYCSSGLDGVSRTHVFKAMMHKIDHPERFLPVSKVSVRPAVGPAAFEGALWRSMQYDGPGPLHGQTVVEHIYADGVEGEIRFVGLDAKGSEGPLEIVNTLLRNPLRIEYYQRDRVTLQRVSWAAPVASAADAIEATLRLAQAAERQAADASDFGLRA